MAGAGRQGAGACDDCGEALAALPDLPTVAESGVPGYEAASWYGVLALAKTPRAIVMKLNSEVAHIAQLPEVRERLAADGTDPGGNSPEEFGAYIRRELARMEGGDRAGEDSAAVRRLSRGWLIYQPGNAQFIRAGGPPPGSP